MSPTAPLRAVAFLGGEGKREALGPRVGVCAGHEKRQLTALPSRAVSSLCGLRRRPTSWPLCLQVRSCPCRCWWYPAVLLRAS